MRRFGFCSNAPSATTTVEVLPIFGVSAPWTFLKESTKPARSKRFNASEVSLAFMSPVTNVGQQSSSRSTRPIVCRACSARSASASGPPPLWRCVFAKSMKPPDGCFTRARTVMRISPRSFVRLSVIDQRLMMPTPRR